MMSKLLKQYKKTYLVLQRAWLVMLMEKRITEKEYQEIIKLISDSYLQVKKLQI